MGIKKLIPIETPKIEIDTSKFLDECPKCGEGYDDRSYIWQVCRKCKWDAELKKYV